MHYKLYNWNKVDGEFQGHEFRRIYTDVVPENVGSIETEKTK